MDDFEDHVWSDELMSTYSVPRITPPPPEPPKDEGPGWLATTVGLAFFLFMLLCLWLLKVFVWVATSIAIFAVLRWIGFI